MHIIHLHHHNIIVNHDLVLVAFRCSQYTQCFYCISVEQTMLRIRNVGLISVTERRALSPKFPLFISLSKELLAQSVGPLCVVVPRLAWMRNVCHMNQEIKQFGSIRSE